ncbi:MAG: aminopeptidase N [Micrococcaceae bacterium]
MTPSEIDLDHKNLHRDEAEARAAIVSVSDYDVFVNLSRSEDLNEDTYPVTTVIRFECTDPGATTFLDSLHAEVHRVQLNGVELPLASAVGSARILLPQLQEHNEVQIESTSRFSTSGEGMHRFRDPGDGKIYLYTQYEPADARRVFPNFEQPDLKARFTFHLIGPQDWVLASNQAEVSRTSRDGVSTVDFAPTPPQSTYITTLLAGPYRQWSQRWDGHTPSGAEPIELRIFARETLAQHVDAEEIFTITRSGLDFFHDLFGVAYPWGKYDQAFVPEYNLGAMENPGLVTFTEHYIPTSRATVAQRQDRANTIMHEMAHMWFGDLVTMRWWDDLWLKESFADYMGTLAVDRATPFDGAWASFAHRRKAWAYVQDQYPTTHPIVADITDLEAARQNFDGITYAKGASVLKQLVAHVGEDAFNEASRRYFERYRWGNATLDDFLAVLSETSGRPMQSWSRVWLQAAGVTHLSWTLDDNGVAVVRQDNPDPRGGGAPLRPHTLRIGRYELDAEAALSRTASNDYELKSDSATQSVPDLDTSSAAERLILLNDDDLSYAVVHLDEVSLETVLQHPLADPLAAATVWASLWNAVRDGRLTAARYLEGAITLAPQLHDVGLHAGVLRQSVTALHRYAPAEERPALAERFGAALLESLSELGDGSDRQRSAVRSLMSLARGSGVLLDSVEDLVRAAQSQRAWDLAPGLGVDDEVRWAALIALAAQGRIDQQRLDAELEVHIDASTRAWHRTAVSAQPIASVRERAWHAVLSGVGDNGAALSNQLLSATAEGVTASHSELITEFEPEFWSSLEQIWSQRSIGIATRTIEGLFPGYHNVEIGGVGAADQHPVVQAAQHWLDEHEQAPHTLRRVIVEELEDLRRALHAQLTARGGSTRVG